MKRKFFFILCILGLIGSNAPLLRGQKALSLDECYRLAYENNREILCAQHEIAAARDKEREVNTYFLPQINVHTGLLHFRNDIQTLNYDKLFGVFSPWIPESIKKKTEVDMSNWHFASVSAIQPVFMGGKIISARKMATEATGLKEFSLRIKEDEVYESIDEAYWQVVVLSSKQKLGQAYLKLINDAVHDVEVLVQTGVATQADVLAVKVKQSEAEMTLSRIENGLLLSRMLLSQRCGLDLNRIIVTQDETQDINGEERRISPLFEDYEIPDIVERRAEIQALTKAENIFSLQCKMAVADMLPHIALVGGYTASSPNRWIRSDQRTWGGSQFLGIGMQLPITGMLTGIFKHQNNKEQLLIRKLQTQDARNKISLQINQSKLNLEQSDRQIVTAQKNLKNAQENLRLAQIGYKEGLIPIINLTAAQTAWMQANDALIEARVAQFKAQSKYTRVIGQGPTFANVKAQR